ncbi:MAG TPA: hypothetical protein VGF93_16910 [Solirubrobacteraceae bacterium]
MKGKRDLDPLCGINWEMVDAWASLVMWVVVVILIAVIAVHIPTASTVSHATAH